MKTIIATVSGHQGIKDIQISVSPDANTEEIATVSEGEYMKQHGINDGIKLQVYEIVAIGKQETR